MSEEIIEFLELPQSPSLQMLRQIEDQIRAAYEVPAEFLVVRPLSTASMLRLTIRSMAQRPAGIEPANNRETE